MTNIRYEDTIPYMTGRATMTQIGLTGGGKNDHMLYISGLPHHKVATDKMIEEVVNLVEVKSKEIKNNKIKL